MKGSSVLDKEPKCMLVALPSHPEMGRRKSEERLCSLESERAMTAGLWLNPDGLLTTFSKHTAHASVRGT